ncbi:MAG: carboxypeptidase regulatory-like domain-containing protein, partial [Pyrinomonadaceae bacterium]
MQTKALYLFVFVMLSLSNAAFGQTLDQMRTVRGTVRIAHSGVAARNASITVAELKKTVSAAEDGTYEIKNIPVGRFQIIAHLDRVSDVVRTVEITGENAVIIDFDLSLAPINEKVTVT